MAETTTKYQPLSKSSDAKPDTLSSAALIMADRSKLMRRIYGGTETMREAEQEILPIYEKESLVRYRARLNSTFALNKLREAVDSASAKPFRTKVQIKNGDPDLELWVKDIDMLGNHLHVFTHQFFNDALLIGQSHILVDHPDTFDMPNLAVQKALARPYFKHIRDDQLIAAYTENVGSDVKVVHARVKGQRVTRTPDFKEAVINQIWVIEIEPGTETGVVQLWEQEATGGGGQWLFVAEKPVKMLEVPLVTLYAGDKERDFVTKPLFQDLAYKQIEHWISSSDQRSILSAARFPMLACSGVTLDENEEGGIDIGPYKVLYSPDAQGRWYFVEPKGQAIESGQKDLEMLEMQMDMMALNPVVATHRQYVPQNERDIQETRVHSVVHDLAISCKAAAEKAVRFMGMWTGNPERYAETVVDLNTDFSGTKWNLEEVKFLLDAWEKRGVSRETFLREARARNLLGENFDLQEELNLLAKADSVDAAMGAAGKEGAGAPSIPATTVVDKSGNPTGQPTNWNGQERPTAQV